MCYRAGNRPKWTGSKKTFALCLFTGQLTSPPDRFRFFTGAFFRWLLVMLPKFHLAENAFPLHLLLQSAERLVDIVVTNHYLHVRHHLSVISGFWERAIYRGETHLSSTPAKGNDMSRTMENLSDVREQLVTAALPNVAFDGWSAPTLEMAVEDCGIIAETAKLAFPRGGIDMALEFHRMMDRHLQADLDPDTLAEMRIRDRITHSVRQRIELVAPHREAVRRGASLLTLPPYAAEGARAVWGTADIIWTACGDTATDYNHYSKRLILGSVYSATVLYWLGDQDPRATATWEFLDRRIENVMRFEKTKADLSKNPLARAAFAVPASLLGLIKAPAKVGKTP